MKFLLDEDTDVRLADYLKDQGHDVTAIVRQYTCGLPDEEVLSLAYQEERILITNDRDYRRLVFVRNLRHVGIIAFHLSPTDLASKTQRLANVLATYSHELTQFIVVTDTTIRVIRQT